MATEELFLAAWVEQAPCAVLVADVAAYSRLMSTDERSTHARMKSLLVNVLQPGVVSYRGRIVKHTGDGFLARFDSCVDAVQCTQELQRELRLAEDDIEPARRIRFRMGLNFGPVLIEDNDIFGHAVNVAARLSDLAQAGGVVISEAVRSDVGDRIDLPVEALGELRLRNIRPAVRAYALRNAFGSSDESPMPPSDRMRRVNIPAVAVLPFRDLDAAVGRSHIGDGILEEIASSLAALNEMLVISPTSTLRYRDSMPDIGLVAQELGVRYVISGSIQRSGRRLRISVLLNDADTLGLVSSSSYEGTLDESFDLQDRIVLDVVGTIAPQIRDIELRRARLKRPESLDAYDCFLRGIDFLRGRTKEEFEQARVMFDAAIETDDTYAPSHAYAAFWHIRNIAQGWSKDSQRDITAAMRLSASAIECEPSNALGLAINGHCKSFVLHDYDAALPLVQRAVARSPNHPVVLSFASLTHSYTGRSALALQQAQHSVRVSPYDMYSFWLFNVLSIAHYANANFQEAALWSKQAFRENRNFAANLRMLAASLSAAGLFEEAKMAGAILIQTDPAFKVSRYASFCPWATAETRERFLDNLRAAGLPD